MPVPPTKLPDLLFLAHRVPYPPDKGDRIRTFQILKYLGQFARIHLACLADEPVGEEQVGTLKAYCERLAIIPNRSLGRAFRAGISLVRGQTATEGAFSSAALRKVVTAWTKETRFHRCLFSSGMATYHELPQLRETPAVVDLVDVDSQKWLDYAGRSRGPRSWLYRLEGRRLRRLEQLLLAKLGFCMNAAVARCQRLEEALANRWAVTLVSQAEAELYRRSCGIPWLIQVIPNGVDLDYFRPSYEEEETSCVFVGALDYRPNVEGVVWFVREIWPKLHAARPQAKFYLVGRQPVGAVRKLGQVPGVILIGQVADVRPYLARSAVAVVPLQMARGVQNKVLEALAMGKATVASPIALAGLKTEAGVHVVTASSAQEWIATIEGLWADGQRRKQLAMAGRRYVEDNHRWHKCLEPFRALLGLTTDQREVDERAAGLIPAGSNAAPPE